MSAFGAALTGGVGTVFAGLGLANAIGENRAEEKAVKRDAELEKKYSPIRLKAIGVGLAMGALLGVLYRVLAE